MIYLTWQGWLRKDAAWRVVGAAGLDAGLPLPTCDRWQVC